MKAIIDKLNYNNELLSIPLELRSPYSSDITKLQDALKDGKVLDLEIKIHRFKRSLNANSAMWAMLNDMAIVLNSTPMEIYLQMLERYGASEFIPLFPEQQEKIKAEYRVTKSQGCMYSNGYKILVWQVWKGTSKYNTLEFSRLLDGVISEAKELGIEFISKADRDLVLSTWEQDKE